MLKSDREALQRNFTVLVEELPCIDVLAFLCQEKILNQEMVSEILIEPIHTRNFSLIFLLQTRGPKAFSTFLNALRYAKRNDLADSLTAFEDKLAKLSI